MLRLNRLEISGFKSFVDPVTASFAPGITAIVGPNGCGKSNLAEALTWALGEQSAKYLRGQRMEDVIFNGAQRRRPLGLAEVNLTLDADPSIEAAVEGQILIGRRVFRTGESQYRLNGKVVALRRIRDLLMDTGLGIRAYSVIGQGQVETILSGKPQERRKLLEEAAGITRYKARKRVAEMKLEEAVGNLHRLDDIVAEVERSLRSLKRQANAARRYQEREAEFEQLLRHILLTKWSQVQEQLVQTRERLAVLRTEDAEISTVLSRDEAALAAGREQVEELAEAVAQRHTRQVELLAHIEGRQEFLKGARQALEDAADRLGRGAELALRLGAEIDGHRQALQSREQRHEELISELGDAQAAVAQDDEEITLAREGLLAAEARLETLRAEILVSNGQITSIQTRLHQEQIEAEKGTFRQEHNGAELERLAEQLVVAQKLLAEGEQLVARLCADHAAKSEERTTCAAELERTLADEASTTERGAELRDAVAARRQRRELLQELETADEERRSHIQEALAQAGVDEPRFLAEELRVPEGWEHSVDLYLEAARDAILVPADEEPMGFARLLTAAGARGTLLQPARPGQAQAATPEDPAIHQSLALALGLPPEYAQSLPPAYLVATGDDAERLARHHPGVAFLSRDRLFALGGLLRIQGEEARPGAFARRRELAEIEAALPALEEELLANEQQLETLIGRRTLQAQRSNQLEQELGELRHQLAVAETRSAEAKQRHDEIEESRKALEAAQGLVAGELGEIAQRRDELRTKLDERLAAHTLLESRFDDAQQELAQSRENRERLSTAGAGRRGRLEVLEERLDSHRRESAALERQITELGEQKAQWHSEAERLDERRGTLAQDIDTAEQQLQSALEERSAGEGEARSAEEQLRLQREELAGLAERVDEVRGRREERQTLIQDTRVEEAAACQDATHLSESFTERFQASIAETLATARAEAAAAADESATPTDGSDEAAEAERPDLDALEAKLEEHRQVLERLGPVNLLAAEEYDEQEERHSFLTEQRADVQGSVESLRRTIREINETSSIRFRETFDEVNKNFNEVFHELFRGGEAEMRLLDEEDLLESGIEIVARPPGKKLQNIMLLSGGEKALTAIALLFALFRTKPSPFCILDEVDAPLDDANVLRFVELLRRYSQDIQFLIISTNKLTMEAASTLYGVTMEEKGVSKLVGVELDDIHPESRLATA
jgi:chromosome segregation protein